MRTSRRISICVAVFTAAVGTAVLSLSLFTSACSSDDGVAPAPAAPTQCPGTLDDANGMVCTDGLVCPYQFTCGAFQQQTTCACANGHLACIVNATDASLAPGATPACTPQSNPGACPSSEPANLSTCGPAGLTCLYDDLVCPGSEAGPNIDTCECQGGASGGLVWNCVIDECASTGADSGVGVPFDGGGADTGSPDAGPVDAGSDGAEVNEAGDDGG